MMNIHPDYYNISQTHTPTHVCKYVCIQTHKPISNCSRCLKDTHLCPHLPFVLSCIHTERGGPHTHQHTLTHILPQASSTASQQGYDHPARMIKLVRHQCSLRRVCVCLSVYVCVSFSNALWSLNRIEVGGTKVGQCQGETYGTIPLPLGRGIAFTEGESHLLSVWKGRGGEKGNVERN